MVAGTEVEDRPSRVQAQDRCFYPENSGNGIPSARLNLKLAEQIQVRSPIVPQPLDGQ